MQSRKVRKEDQIAERAISLLNVHFRFIKKHFIPIQCNGSAVSSNMFYFHAQPINKHHMMSDVMQNQHEESRTTWGKFPRLVGHSSSTL